MASTISAGTSAGTAIAIAGDTTGNLAFTTQAGTYTQTVPNATGTVMVSGNMPAFSAYAANNLSLPNSTNTVITYNTKEFDTNTCFNNTSGTVTLNGISVPAYSFAPNVAGYYQITAGLAFSPSLSNVEFILALSKNGGIYKYLLDSKYAQEWIDSRSCLVYLNGTSDYINIVTAQYSGSTQTIPAGSQITYFQATMTRGA